MQISMFDVDCQKPYKIKKPIRLIELFGGIGSQAKALENLQANFTHYRLCEFDKYAVQSYNAIHGTEFETSDITKITAKDLKIVETDKYDYILTYSFPCQDLSIAGKRQGMKKGSGTRSGLLWEVERLINECIELPQVLLMENVPQVLNSDFGGWLDFLESKGYHNYYKCLNAKNYGIPQNRERCFMVSVLGNYYYDFPKEIPLKLRLKDMLESRVDEKYYLSEKVISSLNAHLERHKEKGNSFGWKPKDGNDIATTIKTEAGYRPDTNFIKEPCCEVVAQLDGSFESTGRIYGADGLCPTINTMGGGQREPKIVEPRILQQPHGYNKGAELDTCPSITTSCWESNNLLKEPIIFDDFNQRVKADQTAINTLTTNCGSTADRNGVKIIEPTIWGSQQEHCAKNTEGVCPTLTGAMGMGGGQVPLHNYDYRIRKLTPKECWRLMGFSDKDFYAAQSAGVSNSQLYKQAGNSIVVKVLEEIFKKLF